jgi:hypothetical protein
MIILLTEKTNISLDTEYLVLNNKVKLIDDYHLECNNQIYEFDYLILENQSFIMEEDLSFIKDGNIIITNWVGQTSIEHIYIGNFDKAIDDLLNN